MAKRMFIPLIVMLICGLLLMSPFLTASALDANALVTDALVANGFAIPRSVIGGGGQRAAGGDYILHGTVGEPVASGFSQGGTYGSSSGFWWPPQYRIYIPLVLRRY